MIKKFLFAAIIAAACTGASAAYATDIPISGQLCYEDFEGGNKFSGMTVITDDDGNHAARICNELTDVVYTPPINTVIEGEFRVESAEPSALFEIITQSSPRGSGYYGGNRYNPFTVDIEHGFTVIGKTIGEDVKLHDGFNTFKIVTLNQKAYFEVNGAVTCAEITARTAGLCFRAESCDVLIDNISVYSISTGGGSFSGITAQKDTHTISSYAPYDFLRGSGVLALFGSNSKVNQINSDDVQYKVEGSYKELSRGFGYFYSDSVVTFTYKNRSCTVNIKIDNGGMSKGEYLAQTVYKRRRELAYIAYYTLNNSGFNKTTAGYSRLFELLSAAYLYPTTEQHDEVIKLFMDIEDTTKYETRGTGASDFISIDLMLLRFNDALNISDETRERLDAFFKGLNLSDPVEELSENHRITYYAIAIAAFEKYPDAVFFNGKSADENKEIYKQYILDWIEYRSKYGMGEYDSHNYYNVDFAALETIYTYTRDIELKRRVYEMLMYLYTDAAMNSVGSVMGGAQSRAYVNTLTPFEITSLDVILDNYKYPDKGLTLQMMPLCYSEFVPQQSLIEYRADPSDTYIYAQKRMLYTIPDDVSIAKTFTKHSYVTPEYIIGSRVEDCAMPKDAYIKWDNYYVNTGAYSVDTRILPDFQTVDFCIGIGGNSLLSIFDSHPGGNYTTLSGAHSYFAGDHGCHCAKYAQHEHTVLGIRHITNKKLPQFSHFYINKGEFDEVIEQNGRIILRSGDVYAALIPVNINQPSADTPYEWGSAEELFAGKPLSELEVKINSPDSCFAAEVYSKNEIGSFEEFKQKILAAGISYAGDVLTYTNIAGDVMELNYKTGALNRNGKQKAYIGNYSDYCRGYIKSVWADHTLVYPLFSTPAENYVNVYKSGLDKYKVIPMNSKGVVCAAVYNDDGALSFVEYISDGKPAEYSGASVKAFLWENMNSIKPVTSTEKY